MRPRGAWSATAHVSLVLCFAAATIHAQQRPETSVADLLRQTRAALNAGNVQQARATAETAAARNPSSSEAQYLLGLIHERENDLAAAAAAYGSAVKLTPSLAEAHDRLGFILGKQGDTAGAIDQFTQAVRLDPRLFDAQYHLGATCWWTRDLAGALPALSA